MGSRSFRGPAAGSGRQNAPADHGRHECREGQVMTLPLFFFYVFSIIAVASALAHRHHISGAATWFYRAVRPIVPMVAAGIAAVAGVVLLVSGTLPASSTKLGILREFLPLSFVEASHLAGSAIGVLLLLVARGLYRKLYRAWIVAMILMLAGFFASLAKGLDTHEAVGMLAAIGVISVAALIGELFSCVIKVVV